MAPGGSGLRALGGWEGIERRGADWAVQRGGGLYRLAQRRVCSAASDCGSEKQPSTSRRFSAANFSSLHLTAIVLKLPGRALLGKAQVGGAGSRVHTRCAVRSLLDWVGSSFWELPAVPELVLCNETVPATGEPGRAPSHSAAVRCPAPCFSWAS